MYASCVLSIIYEIQWPLVTLHNGRILVTAIIPGRLVRVTTKSIMITSLIQINSVFTDYIKPMVMDPDGAHE
jgi:hypothetical protein